MDKRPSSLVVGLRTCVTEARKRTIAPPQSPAQLAQAASSRRIAVSRLLNALNQLQRSDAEQGSTLRRLHDTWVGHSTSHAALLAKFESVSASHAALQRSSSKGAKEHAELQDRLLALQQEKSVMKDTLNNMRQKEQQLRTVAAQLEERLRTTGMQVESERAARGVADAALRQAEQAMAELRTAVELHQRQLADKNHSSESLVDAARRELCEAQRQHVAEVERLTVSHKHAIDKLSETLAQETSKSQELAKALFKSQEQKTRVEKQLGQLQASTNAVAALTQQVESLESRLGDADTHVSQLRHDLQGVRDRLIASTAREEQLVAELEEQKRAHELSRSAVEAVSAERDLAREKARCANASSVELSRRVDELLETNRLQQAETGRLLQQAKDHEAAAGELRQSQQLLASEAHNRERDLQQLQQKLEILTNLHAETLREHTAASEMWRQRAARVLKQEAELGHAIAKLTRAQKAMVSELTCMNCLEIFNKPVVLIPCGHTYCSSCDEAFATACRECGEHVDKVVRHDRLDTLGGKVAFIAQAIQQLTNVKA